MCIVIDTNSLAPVFNSGCAGHREFEPVRTWVTRGRGKVVYGGSRYREELGRADRYRRLFLRLKDAGRAVEVRADLVDEREEHLIRLTRGTDCNDQHIIAILCVSGCMLLCSRDNKSFAHVKNGRLYPKKRPCPKIYQSSKNRGLLCAKHIVKIRNVA